MRSRSPHTLALLVTLVACGRTVTAPDAAPDAGIDVPTSEPTPPDVPVPTDVPVPGDEATSMDASVMNDAAAPDAESLCRGFDDITYCTDPCGACVHEVAAGSCRAEAAYMDASAECAVRYYNGFSLCFASCILGYDAGSYLCPPASPPGPRSCACYDRCLAIQPAACQEGRRTFDRCVLSHCAACRS